MVGIEGTTGSVTATTHRADVTEDNRLSVYATGSNGAPINVILNSADDSCNAEFDSVECALVVIDVAHHQIHDSHHYVCEDYDNDVDSATPKYWHIKAPNTDTRIHFFFRVIFKASGLIQLYEAPTISNNGTALTIYNNDRNSANTTALLAFRDPTVDADGSNLILVNKIGSGKTVGGIESRDNELILKQNTSYAIKCISDANDNQISVTLEFYEA